MQIHSLALENIRSYAREEITFPEGITLLAGDIGCGKSSILLALEFALFGIQRGELSGTALLRHGARTGSVTLTFKLGEVTYAITRTLKRTNSGVGQETGSITQDGVVTEYTAQELKAKILELLNYPAALLSKSKGLLFRYTVYTPQEEMKTILAERGEERIETLRQLFGIDKYKRVRENALHLIRELRKEEIAQVTRIEELGKEHAAEEEISRHVGAVKGKLQEQEGQLAEVKILLAKAKEAFTLLEKERFAYEELQKQHALAEQRAAMLTTQIATEEERANELAGQIDQSKKLLGEREEQKQLQEQRTFLEQHRKKILEKQQAILQQESAANTRIADATSLVQRVGELETCPTCRQEVNAAHKEQICTAEQEKEGHAQEQLAQLATLKEQLRAKEVQAEQKHQELLEKERAAAVVAERRRAVAEQEERLAALRTAVTKLRTEQQSSREQVKKNAASLQQTPDNEQYARARRSMEEEQERYNSLSIRIAELQRDLLAGEKELERLAKRRLEKQQQEQLLQETQERLAWLNKQFLNVAQNIEKALFSSIYRLFNEYFMEWFTLLIEDELLRVRLDSEFTPVIVQNGYETTLQHLSGGERTSVALAYRLALNKVINEFLSSINTRDLLILDEPTDGFSTEQLNRLREVLTRLNLRQVIMVSHEAELEGHVDHILRVTKQEHESRVQ